MEEKKESKRPSTGKSCLIVGGILLGLVIVIALSGFFIFRFSFGGFSGKETAIPSPTISPTPSPTQSIVQAELLDYFLAIATKDSNTDGDVILRRWTKSLVTIEVAENGNDAVNTDIDQIVAAFNKISNTVKLQRVESGGDIKIHFIPRAEMLSKGGKEPDEKIFGWAQANPDQACQLQTGLIYIDEAAKDNDIALMSTLVHEIDHTLGFRGHDHTRRGCNAMTDIACGPMETYTPYDTYAIEALYNSGVPLCATGSQAKTYLQNYNP